MENQMLEQYSRERSDGQNKVDSHIERKEQKELPVINVWYLDQSDGHFKAINSVLADKDSSIDMSYFDDPDELIELLKSGKADQPDIIYVQMVKQPGFVEWELEGVPKFITKIRNNLDIKKQPLIVRGSFLLSGLDSAEQAGADITIRLPFHLDNFLTDLTSVPHLLGKIEDEYGDRMIKNKKGFYKEYSSRLAERSEKTADIEKELSILRDIFQENEVKKVLDAGGGEGRIAIPLTEEGYEVTNVDASHELLDKMKQKNNKIKAIEADLRKLPIDKEQYHAITYNWHVFSDILGNKAKQNVLNEAYRVLNDGGVIVLDLPDRAKGAYETDGVHIELGGGENIFVGYTPSEEEMREYLKLAGFVNIEVNKWNTKNGFPKITFVAKKQSIKEE